MQNGFHAVDDERVPRVVPALEADDGIGTVGEHIDDGTFTFVTPLRANYYDILSHDEIRGAQALRPVSTADVIVVV
jgi:hypothetical protein